MSAALEFLEHLTEAPQTSAELQEISGQDVKTVANRLQALKGLGAVKRTADGWIKVVKANGSHAPINDQVSAAPPPKTAKKKRRAGKRIKARAAEPSEEGMFSFFIDDEFDLQVCRKDGSGEAAIIPRDEALRLCDFLNLVGDIMRSA